MSFIKNKFVSTTKSFSIVSYIYLIVLALSFIFKISLIGHFSVSSIYITTLSRDLIDIFYNITFIVYFIFLLIWVYHSNKNLRNLGYTDLLYTPGWSVAFFIIPIVSLYKPLWNIKDIWHVSKNGNKADDSKSIRLINFWWFLYLSSTIIEQIQTSLYEESPMISLLPITFNIALVILTLKIFKNILALQNELTENKSIADFFPE